MSQQVVSHHPRKTDAVRPYLRHEIPEPQAWGAEDDEGQLAVDADEEYQEGVCELAHERFRRRLLKDLK